VPDKPLTDADWKLEEGLEETFPASDAPANTVETGVRPILPPMDAMVNQRENGDGEER